MANASTLAAQTALLDGDGWFIHPALIAPALVARLNGHFEAARVPRDAIRAARGLLANNDGTLHHLLGDDPVYLDLTAALQGSDALLRAYFGGNYIINSFGGIINSQSASAYIHNVHRDIRFSSDSKRFMLNLLVMLDDFTLDNGATHLLTGSHHQATPPADADFYAAAERAVGPAGSVAFFDSRLWHAAGANRTPAVRRGISITLTSPFFKPQFDYPRRIGAAAGAALSPFVRQLVGFNARVPATLEEYYVPVDERCYQRGQDD